MLLAQHDLSVNRTFETGYIHGLSDEEMKLCFMPAPSNTAAVAFSPQMAAGSIRYLATEKSKIVSEV